MSGIDKPIEVRELPCMLQIERASQELGLDKDLLRRLIKSKKIKATKPGKRWLIYTSSIVKFLKRHENRQGHFEAEGAENERTRQDA